MSKKQSSGPRWIMTFSVLAVTMLSAVVGCGNSERRVSGDESEDTGGTNSGASGSGGDRGGTGSQGGAANGGTSRGGTSSGGSAGEGEGGDESGGSSGTSTGGAGVAGSGGRAGAGTGGGAGRGGAGGAGAGQGGGPGGSGQNGGAGQSGGAGQGGSGGGAAGMVGVLGTSCSPPGALACAGNHQKLTVLCGGDGRWQPNQTCGDGMFCDSTPGVNVGTCRPELPECAAGPGTRFCAANQKDMVTCSADLVATTSEPCDGACRNGACREVSECPVWTDYNDAAACSLECGAPGGSCTTDGLGCIRISGIILGANQRGVIRTPWVEDWCPRCGDLFVSLTIRVTVNAGRAVRMLVPEPFRILDGTTGPCDPQPRCSIGNSFEIYSADRNVGPMNIVVEEVDPMTATCPAM
jgi:hypothetical protein